MMAKLSAEAATIAYSSASALLKAMTFCCRLYVLMTWSPMAMMPPLVLRAVTGHPAQSESVYAVSVLFTDCQGNFITSRGAPARYRPILRIICQCPRFGELIARAASLTAYWISILSGAK